MPRPTTLTGMVSQAASSLVDAGSVVTVPFILLGPSASGGVLSAGLAGGTASRVVSTIGAGTLIDRLGARPVMLGCEAVRAAVWVAAAVVLSSSSVPAAGLVAACVVLGAA